MNLEKKESEKKIINDNETYRKRITEGDELFQNNKRYKQAYELMIYDEDEFLRRMQEIEKLGTFDTGISIPDFFLLPNSRFKKTWDILILLLCLYSVFVLPLELGMFLQYELKKKGILDYYNFFEYGISGFLFVDLILHFRTAIYTSKGEIILDKSTIAKVYFKKYFLFDFLSIITLDNIFNQDLDIFNIYIRSVLKMPRILRLIKIARYMYGFKHRVMKIWRMFFIYFLIAHYCACALSYSVANLEADYQLEEQKINTFLDNKGLGNLYTRYVNLSILILVGNNEAPLDFQQRVIYVMMYYLGTLCDAIIFGNMAIFFAKTNQIEKNKNRKHEELQLLMEILKVDPIVKTEIMDYHEIMWWKHRDKFLNKNIMKDLNKCLKARVKILQFHQNLYDVSPYIETLSNTFIVKLSTKLKQIITHPNDIVTFEGNLDQKLFFISKDGKFSVKINGNIIKILSEGEYFGEVSLFLKCQRRIATVTSINISMLYFLEPNVLKGLFLDFPYDGKEFFQTAFDRFRQSLEYMSDELKMKIFNLKTRNLEKFDKTIWNDDFIIMLRNINVSETI